MDDHDLRLRALAIEYVNYCNLMATPDLSPEDRHYLSSQRTIVHDELIAMTGLARPFDMKSYCADLVAGRARAIFA